MESRKGRGGGVREGEVGEGARSRDGMGGGR